MDRPRTLGLPAIVLPPAVAIVILAIALLVLISPLWMHFALSQTVGVTETSTGLARAFVLSDRTVAELIVGPGTFASFPADEASHMRDVRVVLWGFLGIAATSLAIVVWSAWHNRRSAVTWRSIGRGGLLLAGFVVVVGTFALVAFGVAFELFHRIFFPGGNWAFSADSLLIRLYPYEFWQLTSAAFGVLAIGGGLAVWFLARRRARSVE